LNNWQVWNAQRYDPGDPIPTKISAGRYASKERELDKAKRSDPTAVISKLQREVLRGPYLSKIAPWIAKLTKKTLTAITYILFQCKV
jgi:hypothetical protein